MTSVDLSPSPEAREELEVLQHRYTRAQRRVENAQKAFDNAAAALGEWYDRWENDEIHEAREIAARKNTP